MLSNGLIGVKIRGFFRVRLEIKPADGLSLLLAGAEEVMAVFTEAQKNE